MQFLLLGPLEVYSRGRPVRIGGRLQRALLAALLLRRNTVVSIDELIDALWEQPPTSARASLLNHIGRLRLVVGADGIETTPLGYRLRTRDREVDLDQYLELRARARREDDTRRRAELLREAESLWRGDALADVMLFGSFASIVEALDAERLETLEARVDAELAAGSHLVLTTELERLVARHPLRERLLEQLMVALYRSGRQADALAAYRTARHRLVSELGLEPGESLVRLERAILAHDLPFSSRIRRDAPPSMLTKAIELAPGTYTEKADFAYRLGVALELMGEPGQARDALEEARDRAKLADARDLSRRIQLELDLHRLWLAGGTCAEKLAVAKQTAAESETAGDDLGCALALKTSGLLRREMGQVGQALTDFREASIHSLRAVGTSWPTGTILTHEAEALFLGPTPVPEAIERCDEILTAIPWGPPGPWGLYCALGMLHAMRGDFSAARTYVSQAATACEEYGLAGRATWVSLWEAAVEELTGDLAAAETTLLAARAQLEPASESGRRFAARHARVLASLGRVDDALDTLEQVASPPDDEPAARCERLRAQALATTDQKQAVRLAEDAVCILGDTDLLPLQGEALLDLATVQARAHLTDQALTSATKSQNVFARKGHRVGAKRAKRFDPATALDSHHSEHTGP